VITLVDCVVTCDVVVVGVSSSFNVSLNLFFFFFLPKLNSEVLKAIIKT
jgi:hypothetical protein